MIFQYVYMLFLYDNALEKDDEGNIALKPLNPLDYIWVFFDFTGHMGLVAWTVYDIPLQE